MGSRDLGIREILGGQNWRNEKEINDDLIDKKSYNPIIKTIPVQARIYEMVGILGLLTRMGE